MKKLLLFISTVVSLVSAFGLPPAGDERYKTFFTWTENRKLSWSDFKGEAMEHAAEVAMTASSVEFSYYTKGNQITWTVMAKYFPTLSWSKENKQTDYVLKHEQLHFDITELYARLFRKRLSEQVKTSADLPVMRTIGKEIMKEWQLEENKYDLETKHSIDEQKQAEWALSIQKRLDALQAFSSK